MRTLLLTTVLTTTLYTTALAHEYNAMPDDHAPIGVMGDHNHKAGEWMLGYRFQAMRMDGSLRGDDELTTAQVHQQFMMAPVEMTGEMHMFGLMYGITDHLTGTIGLPYIEKEMTMEMMPLLPGMKGMRSIVKSEGVGDIKLNGLYTLYEDESYGHSREGQKALLQFGLALPTGSIDERANGSKLGYGMQLGSGTWDPILGATFLSKHGDWSWGTQIRAIFRTGKNEEGYRLGNQVNATGWVARELNDEFSISARLSGDSWGNIHGADNDLNAMMSPGNRADMRGGSRLGLHFGLNFIEQDGWLKGHRLAIESGAPLYENLDGIQLGQDYVTTIGWQYAF